MGDYLTEIASLSLKCRFCLSDLNENKVKIDDNLKGNFESLCTIEVRFFQYIFTINFVGFQLIPIYLF